jgi:1,2-dihydroxy-3-keto-5-methylthiopentene dioxygenase
MAIVTLESSGRQITDDSEVQTFLAAFGVEFDRWPVPPHVADLCAPAALDDAQKQAVLDAYRDKLGELAKSHGYIEADLVVLHPETPGLDAALARFDRQHLHTDDEVRYIVDGRGVFGFAPDGHEKFEVEVHPGEYISVPANAWHWFELCEDRRIKAIRLFQDQSGWVPHYRDAEEGA